METIKINEIVKKQTRAGKDFWVVNYDDNKDATIGDWDNQLANYIEHDVGQGGTVSVLIQHKGEYTNITKVDMKSAVKGDGSEEFAAGRQLGNTKATIEKYIAKPTDDRDAKITAAVILKGAVELTKQTIDKTDTNEEIGRELCSCVEALTGAYALALSNVKAL